MTYHVTQSVSAAGYSFKSEWLFYVPPATLYIHIHKLHVPPTQRVCRERSAVAEQSSNCGAPFDGQMYPGN
jgi:hypothetical protein